MKKNYISCEKTDDGFWGQSPCLNNYLHRFSIVNQSEDGVLERCEICGYQEFFKVIDGRVDTVNYLSWHARQALSPLHPTFPHEFPESKLNKTK